MKKKMEKYHVRNGKVGEIFGFWKNELQSLSKTSTTVSNSAPATAGVSDLPSHVRYAVNQSWIEAHTESGVRQTGQRLVCTLVFLVSSGHPKRGRPKMRRRKKQRPISIKQFPWRCENGMSSKVDLGSRSTTAQVCSTSQKTACPDGAEFLQQPFCPGIKFLPCALVLSRFQFFMSLRGRL